MGHLVNPISFRLGVTSFWSSNWVLLNNFNYINVFKKDYLLFDYFYWWFNNSEVWTNNFLYSNYKIYRIYKKIIINIYYYDAKVQIGKGKYKFFGWLFKFFLRRMWFDESFNRKKIINKRHWNKMYRILLESLLQSELLLLKNKFTFLSPVNILNGNNKLDDISFNLYSMDVWNISVEAITSYIGFRLQRKYTLNWVLRPVIKDLNSKMRRKRLLGYKILCSGRFNRNQIATYDWSHKGAIQYSTISSLVKYAEVRVRFKFGVGGIKIWLGFGHNNFNVFRRKVFLHTVYYLPFKYLLKRFIDSKSNYIVLYLNYWFLFFIRIMILKKINFNFYSIIIKIRIKVLLYFFIKINKNIVFAIRHTKKYCFNNFFFYSISLRINKFFDKCRYQKMQIKNFKKDPTLFKKKPVFLSKNLKKNSLDLKCISYLETFYGKSKFFTLILLKNTKLFIFFKEKNNLKKINDELFPSVKTYFKLCLIHFNLINVLKKNKKLFWNNMSSPVLISGYFFKFINQKNKYL